MRRMDTYAKAVAELAEIENKLAELAPLQQRRTQLHMFVNIGRDLYGGGAEAQLSAQLLPKKLASQSSATPVARRLSMRQQIIEGAARLIESHGPMQSRRLAELLERDGVKIGSADKVLAVSTILSREKALFKSHRAAGGWLLVHPHKEATPPSAPTLAGS